MFQPQQRAEYAHRRRQPDPAWNQPVALLGPLAGLHRCALAAFHFQPPKAGTKMKNTAQSKAFAR